MGERVIASLTDGTRFPAIVAQKHTVPPSAQNTHDSASTVASYIVTVEPESARQHLTILGEGITRDRDAFNKLAVRRFLKNSIRREAWSGAPWLVRDTLASRYNIDTTVPTELQHAATFRVPLCRGTLGRAPTKGGAEQRCTGRGEERSAAELRGLAISLPHSPSSKHGNYLSLLGCLVSLTPRYTTCECHRHGS